MSANCCQTAYTGTIIKWLYRAEREAGLAYTVKYAAPPLSGITLINF